MNPGLVVKANDVNEPLQKYNDVYLLSIFCKLVVENLGVWNALVFIGCY